MKVEQVPLTKPAWEPVTLNIVFETEEEFLNFHNVFNVSNSNIASMVLHHSSRRLTGDYDGQFNQLHNMTNKIRNERGLP